MDPQDIAQARCLGYGLLADLIARGVTEATAEPARADARLAAAMEGRTSDELAVDHHHAFEWAAPPVEGAYLDPGRTAGPRADALYPLYREAGFVRDGAPIAEGQNAEDLSTILRALAFLSGAEADAIEDGHAGAMERTRELSRRLLDEHALAWVPVWAAAVRRLERAFPTALAEAVEELLLMHRGGLAGAPRPVELPDAPALLDDESTGLREIGEWLSTPALCGAFLTREDIKRLGRGVDVPRGFGSRAQILINLLRSAASYDAFRELLGGLDVELGAHVEALAAPRYEGVAELVAPWRRRVEETRATLRKVERAAFESDA